jgi:hypothetical protein
VYDAKFGYYQILITANTQKKAAFETQDIHCQTGIGAEAL